MSIPGPSPIGSIVATPIPRRRPPNASTMPIPRPAKAPTVTMNSVPDHVNAGSVDTNRIHTRAATPHPAPHRTPSRTRRIPLSHHSTTPQAMRAPALPVLAVAVVASAELAAYWLAAAADRHVAEVVRPGVEDDRPSRQIGGPESLRRELSLGRAVGGHVDAGEVTKMCRVGLPAVFQWPSTEVNHVVGASGRIGDAPLPVGGVVVGVHVEPVVRVRCRRRGVEVEVDAHLRRRPAGRRSARCRRRRRSRRGAARERSAQPPALAPPPACSAPTATAAAPSHRRGDRCLTHPLLIHARCLLLLGTERQTAELRFRVTRHPRYFCDERPSFDDGIDPLRGHRRRRAPKAPSSPTRPRRSSCVCSTSRGGRSCVSPASSSTIATPPRTSCRKRSFASPVTLVGSTTSRRHLPTSARSC